MGALTDGIPPRRRAADINTYESELPRINMHSQTYSLGRVKDGGPLAGKSYLESPARESLLPRCVVVSPSSV